MNGNENILTAEHLVKSYRGSHRAVDDCSFVIPRGHIVGPLGPNARGKTTTIKMINGLLRPDEGEILIDGEKPGIATHAMVSYMPDRTFLDLDMKISSAIAFYADVFGDFNCGKAKEMRSELGLEEDAKLKELSKGMLEKLQLLLVMSRDAQLYVLDEPIGGVDPAARESILHSILNNSAENAAILISTHLIAEVENILDDVILMHSGHVVLQEPAEQLRAEKGKSVNSYFKEVFA